jgi:hypothetical protein
MTEDQVVAAVQPQLDGMRVARSLCSRLLPRQSRADGVFVRAEGAIYVKCRLASRPGAQSEV